MRVQSSARESLREFVLELASTLKNSFEERVADVISLGHSQVAVRFLPFISSLSVSLLPVLLPFCLSRSALTLLIV
jgi:hypothetical protein